MDVASEGSYRRVAIVPSDDTINVWVEIGEEASTRHRSPTVYFDDMRVLLDSEGTIYLESGDSDGIHVVARDDAEHVATR